MRAWLYLANLTNTGNESFKREITSSFPDRPEIGETKAKAKEQIVAASVDRTQYLQKSYVLYGGLEVDFSLALSQVS
jgi:hypothetical protein